MDKNDRDFDKEIEELEIQKLISKQPSYEDVMTDPTQKAFRPKTKKAYDDEIREECRLKLVDMQIREMNDKKNAVIYEKSTVLGLRKYMEWQLRELKEDQDVIKRMIEEMLEKLEARQ